MQAGEKRPSIKVEIVQNNEVLIDSPVSVVSADAVRSNENQNLGVGQEVIVEVVDNNAPLLP